MAGGHSDAGQNELSDHTLWEGSDGNWKPVQFLGIQMPHLWSAPHSALAAHRMEGYLHRQEHTQIAPSPIVTEDRTIWVRSKGKVHWKGKDLFGVVFMLFGVALGCVPAAPVYMGIWRAVCGQPQVMPNVLSECTL